MPPPTHLLVVAIGALVLFLAYALYPTKMEDAYVKAHTLDTMDPTSPLGQLCTAHRLLSDLHAATPNLAPTLFQVLNLNPYGHPFFPPSDCAYPHSKNHGEAHDLMRAAWETISATISANDDDLTTEWRNAVAVVTSTLLNDVARTVYMREMLPNIQPDSEAWWRNVCERVAQSP